MAARVFKASSPTRVPCEGHRLSRPSPFSKQVGDTVLAPENRQMYEATVRRVETRDDVRSCFVHYHVRGSSGAGRSPPPPLTRTLPIRQGWETMWDRWVAEADLRRPDELCVCLPPVFKTMLVEDWWRVNEEGTRVVLPREPSVRTLLRRHGESGEAAAAFADDFIDRFNATLSARLLYRHERAQHAAVTRDGAEPADVYGIEHLIRLFVEMPKLLVFCPHPIARATLRATEVQFRSALRSLERTMGPYERNPDFAIKEP